MADNARVYIGFDSKEVVAYHVFCQSILEKSSIPVEFLPISLNNLGGIFTRERNQLQSTEFSFSRFLVPYLSNYEGWSLFADCDMLMRTDIAKLWDLRDDRYAAMCVRGCLKKRWVISTGYDSFGFARFDGVHDGLDQNHPSALCPADGTLCKRHDKSGMGTG